MNKGISFIIDGERKTITLDYSRLQRSFENNVDGFLRFKKGFWRYIKYLDTFEDRWHKRQIVYFTPYMNLEYLILRSIIFKDVRSIRYLKIDVKKKIDFLHKQLKIAIKDENYELAAKIRDRISSLGKKSKK